MFNPSHAAQHLDPNGVDALYDIKPIRYHIMITGMKSVVHAPTSPRVRGRRGRHVEHGGLHQRRLALLAPQRQQVPDVGGRRAHHVRHVTPNSASAERVFSLPKAMFGDARAPHLLVGPRRGLPHAQVQQGQAQGRERGDGAGCWPQLVMPILSCSHPIYTPLPPQSPGS